MSSHTIPLVSDMMYSDAVAGVLVVSLGGHFHAFYIFSDRHYMSGYDGNV